jgi:hypothetical protein
MEDDFDLGVVRDPRLRPDDFYVIDDGSIELGIVRDSTLHATNNFAIWELRKATRLERFACWMNGWLPWSLRLGAG